jgi:uncharacterized protein
MLTPAQTRVLGCLVEKHLTTPQHYPLTENALIAACNQSTNRDPVVRFDATIVRRALVGLREHGLAREVHRPGERAAKHRHLLDEALGLDVPAIGVLAVLMLRGPQTAAELRARTERMHPFSSTDEVEQVLDALATHPSGALAARQERRPGQKEARYAHLMTDPLEEDEAGVEAQGGQPPGVAHRDAETLSDGSSPPAGGGRTLVELAGTVDALRADVASLRTEMDFLRDEVASLRAGQEPGGGA